MAKNNGSKFQAIAREVTEAVATNVEMRICPDQCVGTIGSLSNVELKDFPTRFEVNRRPKEPAVLLILESPHIQEFKGVVGPAKGKTGTNIRQYLRDILLEHLKLQDVDSYHLVLLNAIQYQCSLGACTSAFRSDVFERAWKSFGQIDFIQRLNQCFSKEDIVVNSCTTGNHQNGELQLRTLVEKAISKINSSGSHISIAHPSYWQVEKNRQNVSVHSRPLSYAPFAR